MPTVFSTKFVRLLKTWEEDELKAFETWLQSPWCNSNKNLIQLFGQLKRYYPNFSDQKLTKEKLFHKVLPHGKYSDRRMNNLMSEGYLAAEKFMVFQRFSNERSLQTGLLSRELQSRYLDDWFFKTVQKQIGQLHEKEVKDWEDYLDLLCWHRLIYHHPTHGPRLQQGANTINEMAWHLDLLYLLEKAAIINEKILRNRILRDENHQVAVDLKIWHMASESFQDLTIDLYKRRFAYHEENFLDQYQNLKTIFLQRFEELNEKEQKTHLLSLINDTILLIKMGQVDITESLPLYQLGLVTGIIINQGKITRNTYTLIVSASNTKGDFAFTSHFIETYSKYLDEKIREDSLYWAHAHTAYWRKELQACLVILQQYHFKITYFQLVSRVLNVQAYFDLYLKDDSYQFYLFNFLDSFEKWLSREKIFSKANILSFQRFVQKCRALAKYFSAIKFEAQKVEKLLEDEESIQVLNWLKQKQKEVLHLRNGKTAKPQNRKMQK